MNTLISGSSQHSGKSVKRLLRRAVRAVRTNQFSDAIKFIDEVLERQPDNARANALKFTTFYMSKQLEKAREVGTFAASLNPKSDYIANNQACLQLSVGKAVEAEELLNTLVEQRGDNPQWLYNLALAQAQLGKFKEAITTFNRVLDIQPDYHKALLQRAAVELKMGLHEEAFQTLNILRLVTPSQHTSSASHLYQGLRFNQFSLSSLQQEMSIWGDYFIPKNKAYDNPTLDTSKPLNIGFIIGSTLRQEWQSIVRPVINAIAKLGHTVTVYWHQTGILPISKSSDIVIKNCRSLSDADFARLCREVANDVIIDVGGMHAQTRERALGINIASRQYAWLVHAGVFSTPLIRNLDDKLGNYRFAIQLPDTTERPTLPKNAIAAIGCEAGLSLKTIQTWAKILQNNSKKLALDVKLDRIQQPLIERFEDCGIDPKRLVFVDDLQFKPGQLVLDNIDYNAISKTCSALNDGAIVISLKGELFTNSRTAALFELLDCTEWVCDNEQDYLALADKLIASTKKAKKDQKQAIAERIKASGLDDLTQFAQHLIQVL